MPVLAADAIWSRLVRGARRHGSDAPIHATEPLEL
jgi:hypothetical protein